MLFVSHHARLALEYNLDCGVIWPFNGLVSEVPNGYIPSHWGTGDKDSAALKKIPVTFTCGGSRLLRNMSHRFLHLLRASSIHIKCSN